MTADDLRELLADSEAEEFLILALLALAGEPMGRQRILEHMMAAGATLPPEQWAERIAARPANLGLLREPRLSADGTSLAIPMQQEWRGSSVALAIGH